MKDNMVHLVIFGASAGGIKVAKTFHNLGIKFEFFVDNDRNKIGKIVEGRLVREPKELTVCDTIYTVIIASMFYKEIKDQLLLMGIKESQIIPKEEFIIGYFEKHPAEIMDHQELMIKESGNRRVLMDMTEGIRIAGAEKWALTVTEALKQQGNDVTILTTEEENNEVVLDEVNVKRFSITFDNYKEAVTDLAYYIKTQLPCAILLNRINQIYMASHIIKRLYGDKLKIISVLHGDFLRLYDQNVMLKDIVDAYLCVSEDIRRNFSRQLALNNIYFKNSPIPFEEYYTKEYTKQYQPIIIGYGARLEVALKRADLLIPLIQHLEELSIDYELHIAGIGSCYDMLKKFILLNSLQNKVKLFGELPFERMGEFWKACDIFINVSDTEGTSISMLEAMSFGVVPIVTETSGVRQFIHPGENGYITQLGDIKAISEYIYELSSKRELLQSFGSRSREIIKKECNMGEYADFLQHLINEPRLIAEGDLSRVKDTKERLVIFGTGQKSKNVLKKFDYEKYQIIAFIDNDIKKVGQKFEGLPIFSPDKLNELEYDKIMICSVFYDEIKKQLLIEHKIENNRIDNFLYCDKKALLSYYEKHNKPDAELAYLLERIRYKELEVFNYDFTEKYKQYDINVEYENENGMFYVLYHMKKMYFPHKFDTIHKVKEYYRSLLIEQDKESPHCYRLDEFDDLQNCIVVDAGAAEGIFSLDILEEAKAIYLVEADEEWVKALNYTFQEYKERVYIINKYLSDFDDDTHIKLDSINGGRVDYIKLDIEGAETIALNGAEKIFSINPKLRIVACAYHNQEDEKKLSDILTQNHMKVSVSKGYMYYDYNVGELTSKTSNFRRGLVRGIKY